MIFAANEALSNIGIIASVGAVIVPAAWWVARQTKKSVIRGLADQTEARDAKNKLLDLEGTLTSLDSALRSHMNAEDRTNGKIENLGNELLGKLADLESGIKGNQAHMMKALMAADPIPTQLWEVRPGHYDLLWANRAYLDLVSLTLAEAKNGGVWLAVDLKDRSLVRLASEGVGQAGEDYAGTFMLVNPHTQEPIGQMNVEGHFIQGVGDHYFYLTTLTREPEK